MSVDEFFEKLRKKHYNINQIHEEEFSIFEANKILNTSYIKVQIASHF